MVKVGKFGQVKSCSRAATSVNKGSPRVAGRKWNALATREGHSSRNFLFVWPSRVATAWPFPVATRDSSTDAEKCFSTKNLSVAVVGTNRFLYVTMGFRFRMTPDARSSQSEEPNILVTKIPVFVILGN